MRNERKPETYRYDESFDDTDENLYINAVETEDININKNYINNYKQRISFLTNNKMFDNRKSIDNIILSENHVIELNDQNNYILYNDFSKSLSKSYSNVDLDFNSNKKIELTEQELNCTNNFLNMSQFDQASNNTINKYAKGLTLNSNINGNFLD